MITRMIKIKVNGYFVKAGKISLDIAVKII